MVKDFLSCLPLLQPFPALAWAKLLQMCNASSSTAYPGSCIHVAAIKGSLPLGLSFTVASLAHCLSSVPLLPFSPFCSHVGSISPRRVSRRPRLSLGFSLVTPSRRCVLVPVMPRMSLQRQPFSHFLPSPQHHPAVTQEPFLQGPPTRPLSHPNTSQGFPLRGFCRARGKDLNFRKV